MIQEFVDKFIANKEALKERFKTTPPESYDDIVKAMVETIDHVKPLNGMGSLDPTRITRIDHGDYQGTLLFIIAEQGYQPHTHYQTTISYGSCGVCDTLLGIKEEENEDTRLEGYYTLALHLVQKLKKI